MIYKMSKLRSNHANLEKEYVGYAPNPPSIGDPFLLYISDAYIRTTPVTEVDNNGMDNNFKFRTANSEYELTVLQTSDIFNVKAPD